MMRALIVSSLLWTAAGLGVSLARADVFLLASGGRIEGQLLNPDRAPQDLYVVATRLGGQLALSPTQIRQVVNQSEAERAYRELLPKVEDTADDHWQMAQWCLDRDLLRERNFHLEQVILRDPQHEEAHKALGYSRIDGKWVTPDEYMLQQGYVRFQGAWRLPQEVAMANRQRAQELAEKDWRAKLRMWRSWLGKRRHDEAIQNIRAANDWYAASGLAELLDDEQVEDVKLLLIEVLGKIDSGTSSQALVKRAMDDASDRVRDAALEQLSRRDVDYPVRAFIHELKSKDNVRVNRAAVALGRLKDSSAVLPLIEALVTQHKFLLQTGQGNMSASFGTGPGGQQLNGFSAGGGGPKLIQQDIQNRSVLDALAALAPGANFAYDKERWKQWYSDANTPSGVNLRRSQ